jgi:hypothetical protein
MSYKNKTFVLVRFCYYYKTPEITNLKRRRFILVHSFGGFSPWSVGSAALGHVARQYTTAGLHGTRNC